MAEWLRPVAAVQMRVAFKGRIIAAGSFEPEGGEAIIKKGDADLVPFGRDFVSNTELPRRTALGLGLTPYDRATFYGGYARAYTDYSPYTGLWDDILAHQTMAEDRDAVFSQLPSSPSPGTFQAPGNRTKSTSCPLTTTNSLHIHLIMSAKHHNPAAAHCLCGALRQASRAVSRLYDEELRGVGLRTTQYSLLRVLARAGQVRQGDLSGLTSLDETTLTRNLRPLLDARWIAVRSGDDRREKLVTITKAGTAKLAEARPRVGAGAGADAGAAAGGRMAAPAGGPPGARQANGRGLIFLPI